MTTQRILGIDPGLNTTGYGVIDVVDGKPTICEAGVIRSKAKETLEFRVNEIFSGVRDVIADHQPQFVALEQLYSHYERPQTAILMGHARGVICLAAAQSGLIVESYAPTRVKKVITGNGRAPKHQIQHAIQLQFGLTSHLEPNDVADALAIALCGYHLSPTSSLG